MFERSQSQCEASHVSLWFAISAIDNQRGHNPITAVSYRGIGAMLTNSTETNAPIALKAANGRIAIRCATVWLILAASGTHIGMLRTAPNSS